MSDVIFLSDVRISFPHLVEPQRNVNAETGKERVAYNGDFIMPPNHLGYQAFMKRYGELAVDKWKEHAQNAMTMIHADRKQRCYGAGEEKVNKKTFVPYDGYAGNVYLSASRDTPPQVIQADGKPIDPANTMAYQQLTRKIYGGCRVNVAIKPWIQANKHGNGIRCDLVAIQFLRDDTAFGEGVVDASGMFGQVAQAAAPTGASMLGMPAAPFPGAAPAGIPGLPPFMSGQ